jgi:hypothetical protein
MVTGWRRAVNRFRLLFSSGRRCNLPELLHFGGHLKFFLLQ